MKKIALLASTLTSCLTAGAQSAWLPNPQQLIVTPSISYQTYDEFWAGNTKVSLPDDVDQYFAGIMLEYGITPVLAADLTIGYTRVETTAFGGDGEDDGLADTTFGLRWKFLDEGQTVSTYTPTLTLRVGGIIEGTYDENFPFSAGDGASGGQVSLLMGKEFGDSGFGIFGDLGYRMRGDDVPDDLFGSFGVYKNIDSLTLSLGYRHIQGLSGENIGDPGFTFPEVREIQQNIEAGVGFTDRGGRYYQLFYSHTLDGKNTGDKDVFGLSASIPFDFK